MIKKEELLKELEKQGLLSEAISNVINSHEDELDEFGLNFKDCKEEYDSDVEFIKDEELSVISSKEQNILIEGKDIEVMNKLKSLNKKVDIIYHNPTYIRDDGYFLFNNKKIYSNDPYQSSLWLSKMKNRLELSKSLLNDQGMVVVSIDDSMQAELKVLMDSIFGKENFISNIVWKSGGGKSQSKFLAKRKEYLLIYRKGESLKEFNGYKNKITEGGLKDDKGYYELAGFSRGALNYIKSMDYPIEAPDGTYIYPCGSKESYEERQRGNHLNNDWRWTLSKKEYLRRLENNEIVFTENNGEWKVYYKSYLKERYTPFDDLFLKGSYQGATLEYNKIMNNEEDKVVSNKPTILLKHILSLYPNKNAIVLEVNGESAAMANSVIDLNSEDGGNRKFITIAKNDISKKILMDEIFNNEKYQYLKEKYDVTEHKYTGEGSQALNEIRNNKISDMLEDNIVDEIMSMKEIRNSSISRKITYKRIARILPENEGLIVYTSSKKKNKNRKDRMVSDERDYIVKLELENLREAYKYGNLHVISADNIIVIDTSIRITDEIIEELSQYKGCEIKSLRNSNDINI